VQCAVTWRGDNAGENGCLRGRDPWDPLQTAQVRSGKESMDATRTRHRPEGPRWMHAYRATLTCCQPDSRATIPRIPERNRNRKHRKRRKPRLPYIQALYPKGACDKRSICTPYTNCLQHSLKQVVYVCATVSEAAATIISSKSARSIP
jgi:hypothetical protein